MARISTKLDEKVFKISKFLGVNESPNGDTGLQLGEASAMQNFKITDEGALQKRAGTRNVASLLNDYTVEVEPEAEIVKTEINTTTWSFTARASIAVTEGGIFALSGASVEVNAQNISNYTGWYWMDEGGRLYQIGALTYMTPEEGEAVPGGKIKVGPAIGGVAFDYPQGGAATAPAWTDVRIVGGALVLEGEGTFPIGQCIGKYMKDGSKVIRVTHYEWLSVGYPLVQLYGDVVTVAGNDTYTWNFHRVNIVPNTNDTVVRGIWSGFVGGKEYLIAAANGHLWSLTVDDEGVWTKEELGAFSTANPVHMFGFDNKLYILNGEDYYVWDGTILVEVDGYVPLISVARSPDGANQTTLEQINMLNSKRRVWFSPDGTAKDFILPNEDIVTIDYVRDRITGQSMQFTADVTGKKVTFSTAPSQGVNTIEVGYSVAENQRNEVIAMRFSEIYSGTTDNRVFLYGDGTNKAFYSGIDYDGNARADYFPAMNVLHVGDTATPITGMIRHYNKLMAFKTDSAYTIDYDTITLVDGSVTAGFFVKPVNRGLGNSALGQVCLVENNPRTLDAGGIYEWQTNAFTYDQRNAVRVSDKVAQTLKRMDLERAVAFYDKITHEYFVAQNGLVVVQNLQNGAWYVYANLPITCMINYKDEFYFGTPDGYIRRMSRDYFSDNGEPIECYWESGSTNFNAPHRLKYSRGVWVTIKPEVRGEIKVTAITDKVNQPAEWSTSASGFFSFLDLDFETLSFNTSRMPTMEAHRIKAKKFVYYKLIFASDSNNTTATVTDVAMHVRYLSHVR